MSVDHLRDLQAPLEARYREDPSLAVRTLVAKGRVTQSLLTCTLESGKSGIPAGLHPAAGGDGSAASAAEMLLEALVSCVGVTLAAVATGMGVTLEEAVITAEGELDFRGTLGLGAGVPVGFTKIRLLFALRSDAGERTAALVERAKQHSVVAQTLAKSVTLETKLA